MAAVDHARDLARSKLADALPRRWRHVQAVASKAAQIAVAVDADSSSVLVAAAWLHDVGYAPDLADTGFHPLDGARWLRRIGFDERVAALVAHHSCALAEADERGLRGELASEFLREDSPTADLLWFCDMTTGPDGQDLPVEGRLAEVRSRYGPGDVVTRFIERAADEITATVHRAEAHLRASGISVQPMYGAGRSS